MTVTKELKEPPAKKDTTLWWKEDNWSRMKKAMEIRRNPAVDGVWDEACLELGKYPVP